MLCGILHQYEPSCIEQNMTSICLGKSQDTAQWSCNISM